MGDLSAESAAVSSASNSGIASPVLVSEMSSSFLPGFQDQDELNHEWSLFQEQLKTRTLTHRKVWEVLSSGIMQTDTGKCLRGLFVDAMVRSFPRFASLDEGQLKYLFDVLCGLPPNQWQAALGEDFRLTSAENNGLARRIQSQLDTSCAQRAEQIESGQLLANAPWETLKTLTQEGRRYIPEREYALHGDDTLDDVLMMLEDASEDRPSPKDVHADLDKFVRLLEQRDVTQVLLPERYVTEVKALRDLVKPDDEVPPSWLEWMFGPGWLEQLRAYPLWSVAPDDSTPEPKCNPGWPLSSFQRFERNASFKLDVTTTGLRIPDGIAGKLLWVCNVLHSFGQLSLGSSHISPYARAKPSDHAWKNGASDFTALPFEPAAGQPQATSHADPLTAFTQFIAKADELFTRGLVPWNSASAQDPDDAVIEMQELFEPAYQTTTEVLSDQPPVVEVVREQVQGLLQRMATSLVSTGVAAWSSTGALIERHSGRVAGTATGAFAVYVAVSNLYAYLRLPEPTDMVDPLQGVNPDPNNSIDIELLTHEYTIEGVLDLFEDYPDFAEEVKRLINASDYANSADDPQLVKGLGALLQQPIPGLQNLTYREYVHAINHLADWDAHTSYGYSISESSGVNASLLNCAGLLIESVQHEMDANIHLQPGEEIAPGMTIEKGADIFVDAFFAAQNIYDPLSFMNEVINRTISESDLPERIKSKLTPDSIFRVNFRTESKITGLMFASTAEKNRDQTFTLLELFAGVHHRAAKPGERVEIMWLPGYTEGFKSNVAETNFLDLYKENIKNVRPQSEAVEFWKIKEKNQLTETLNSYLHASNSSASGRHVVSEYFKGNIRASTLSIRNSVSSNYDSVANAVYLGREGAVNEDNGPGLFVFLGEAGKVIECSLDLFASGGRSIEEFPELSLELSKRIPIQAFLSRKENDFKYSQGRLEFVPQPVRFRNLLNIIAPIWVGEQVEIKLPFKPILLEWGYGPDYDLFEDLHKRQLYKVVADIDAMTSTPGERITDQVLDFLSATFASLSMVASLIPGGITKVLALLFGLASSAITYARGAINDDPEKTAMYSANALRGAFFAFAGPFVAKHLGKALSNEVSARIAATAIERVKALGRLPAGVIKYLPKYKKVSAELIRAVGRTPKWIPPVKMSKSLLSRMLENKHRGHWIITKLNRLARGPHVAQKLMDGTGVVFFSGPGKGYVYKGFVMRGDLRSPDIVFKEGFQLRTPITDIKQVNGMRGGFGGGKDALDPDGMGISTSAFYSDSGAGAFRYGGGRGGYTYVIDARRMEGFDLYKNQNFASHRPLEQGFKPWEINYGKNIPGSNIVGAYDANGVFFPNPDAIAKSIASSTPKPVKLVNPAPVVNSALD